MFLPQSQTVPTIQRQWKSHKTRTPFSDAFTCLFGVTLAKENPNAHVTAVDWPAVLKVAKENAEEHGVAGRYEVRPGSAFETELVHAMILFC